MKLFITASPEVRAMRRWQELQDKGAGAEREYGHVLTVRMNVGLKHCGFSGCMKREA